MLTWLCEPSFSRFVSNHDCTPSAQYSPAFVAAARPAHAVFATGYRNRFGHPKAEVADRYAAAGAALWRTDRDGAVTIALTDAGAQVSGYRDARRRYWR
mgnify:CR=1 FL=1